MAAPSSSCSSSTEVRVDLAERISKARLDYAELPEVLCPSSRPSSPSASSRAEGMKQAIMDAVLMANSNTTHPKWGHVARMVRLNCTRRGYVGAAERVRIGDVQKAEIPEVEWTLPETEEDWERYVKRWGSKFRSRGRVSKYFRQDEEGQDDPAHSPTKKAEIIREKVTTWQATITPMGEDPTPTQDETSTITTAVNKVKVDQKGIGSQGTVSKGSLGFAIVKRPTALTKKQGKGSNQDALLADDAPNVPQSPADVRMSSSLPQSVATAPVVELQPPAHISSEPNAMISEVSEVSLFPPSFPSQLRTSTPPPGKAKARPPPIISSSPLSSPPLTHHIPPPIYSDSSSALVNKAQKRGRSNSPRHSDAMDISDEYRLRRGPPNKKARRAAPDSSSSAAIPPPSTPPPPASSASNDAAPSAGTHGLGNADGLPLELPTTPERQALPTLTELLASSRRSKARPRPPSRKTKSAHQTPRRDDGLAAADADDGADADTDREPSPARTFFSSPASGSSSSSPRFRPRSPVSPMFSQNPGTFAPAFVSSQPGGFLGYGGTQIPGPLARTGSGVFGLGYNSQFDVEGGISRAAELLDRDVDYADWLRDIPEAEDEAASLKQSQSEVAV